MFETVLMAGNTHSLVHAAERVEPRMVVVDRILAGGTKGLILDCAAPTELLLAVREVLQGRRYISPALKAETAEASAPMSPEAAT